LSPAFHDSRRAEPLSSDSASQSPVTQITTYNYSEQNPWTGDYCWPKWFHSRTGTSTCYLAVEIWYPFWEYCSVFF
jgi:hypothetical protein